MLDFVLLNHDRKSWSRCIPFGIPRVLFELALARQTQSLVTMNVSKTSDRFNSQLCNTSSHLKLQNLSRIRMYSILSSTESIEKRPWIKESRKS